MDQIAEQWTQLREDFPVLLNFAMNLAAAIVILIIGIIIARWLRKRLNNSKVTQNHINATLRPVIASSVFYLILAVTFYAFLTKLGVPSTSLLAIFGAAGLGIALALKDTLSNIAAGVMLLFLRPLQIGEFVDTSSYAGTVQEIGLFATTLKNIEGLYIYVPNSEVWRNRLQNFARHTERKFMETIGVGYGSDLRKTQEIVLGILNNVADVKELPTPPECYVMNFGDSAITLSCRCWIPADNWLARTSEIRIAIKSAFDKEGIEIPFPQRVVTTKAE
ncbi:mechanosensitive ion channel family protein [Hellea sp.]|nr:mechanosensitive ion channel family protein [Hellea sp.]